MTSTIQDQKDRHVAVCRTCRLEKSWSDFDSSPTRRPHGLSSNCHLCENTRKAEQQRRKRREGNFSLKDRQANLKKKFGITVEDYENMSKSQNHCCLICSKPESDIHSSTGKPQRLAVDHNHKTGKVRGLLCAKCNKGIGLLQDDPDLLKKAAQYLLQASF